MKRTTMLSLAAALGAALAGLGGCAGWSAEGRRAYLEAVTVRTPELASIADGHHLGSYTLTPPRGGLVAYPSVAVDVTMDRGAIAAVDIVVPPQLATGDFYDAIVAGPNGVIARQSLDVDSVTGASYSSKAFLKAMEAALTD